MQAQLTTFGSALRGTPLQQPRPTAAAASAAAPLRVEAATQVVTRKLKASPKNKPPPPPPRKSGTQKVGTKAPAGTKAGGGTRLVGGTAARRAGGTQVIEVYSKEKLLRDGRDPKAAPRILSRIQQLKLLSKLEQTGLLSLAEKNGLTLSAIEKSGLLSKAESLGLISLIADRNFPGVLYAAAATLLAVGPAAAYLLPDDSAGLIAAQVALALACTAGGAASWGGAALLSTLQK